MLKVLLVDDEPVILEGLKVMIDWEQEGLQVVGSATDGMEAFRMIRELSPDIVITDIKMPRMSGLELLERVREKGDKQTGFIVLTGFDDFSYARRALKLEAIDYLLKPVEKKELLGALKKASMIHEEINRSRKTPRNTAPRTSRPTVAHSVAASTKIFGRFVEMLPSSSISASSFGQEESFGLKSKTNSAIAKRIKIPIPT